MSPFGSQPRFCVPNQRSDRHNSSEPAWKAPTYSEQSPLSATPEHYLAGQSLSPTPLLPDRVCQNAPWQAYNIFPLQDGKQSFFRKFRQDSADKDIVTSFCEVGHKEQGTCLASLYLLFYVINNILFPSRKFLQKFLPAKVANYIEINLGYDAGVYTMNPVSRWASE